MLGKKVKNKILGGRKVVEAYRIAHAQLHSKPWHKEIPEAHTPLLNIMLNAFKGLGFNSPYDFWRASDELNIEEFGISSGEASPELLKEMWF